MAVEENNVVEQGREASIVVVADVERIEELDGSADDLGTVDVVVPGMADCPIH